MQSGETRITVYRGLEYRATIPQFKSIHMPLQFDKLSVSAFALDLTSPYIGELMHRHARVVVHFRRSWEDRWEWATSGKVTEVDGEGFQRLGVVAFVVEDDWRIFNNWHGWPNPAGTLAQQGSETAYDTRTGNAEAILKSFTQAAINRLGMAPRYTVAPNRNRGATIPGGVSMRFHPLADRLWPAVSDAGIGVTVRQGETSIVVDCYVPKVIDQVLTESAGVLTHSKWSVKSPTLTRVVAGGGGEGTNRYFRQIIDPALEAEWDDVVEGFQDARDTSDPVVLDQRCRQRLVEGRPAVGITPTLSETKDFRFGGPDGYGLGDRVTIRNDLGLVVPDIIRTVTIVQNESEPFDAEPSVGDQDDDNEYLPFARAISGLQKNLRDLEVSR